MKHNIIILATASLKGGNGGNLINGDETSIELQLGNIKGIVGSGGVGSNTKSKDEGTVDKKYN